MTGKTASGVDFSTINEKGNVPCVVLDDGTVLNEGAATLQVSRAGKTKQRHLFLYDLCATVSQQPRACVSCLNRGVQPH
jgi:hypothetical protein